MDDDVPPKPQQTLKASFFDILQSEIERQVDLGSADAGWMSRAEDTCWYVLKDKTTKNSAAQVPHCEWFCTHLGDVLQIPSPQFKIIRKIDGELVFGSRWAGGLVPTDNNGFWFDRVRTGEVPLQEISVSLSKIYAFDLFVHNVDRHRWNFMLQKQFDNFVLLSNDYSRAWIRWGFPLPDVRNISLENTCIHKKWLESYWGERYILPVEVDKCLAKILTIPNDRIRRIIEDHPDERLPEINKNDILTWWGSDAMIGRVAAISEEIKNGTYL